MAEQLTCNQQVVGSIPIASSTYMGRFPSGQREQTVNLSSPDFGGPNPPLPTKNIRNHLWLRIFFVGKGEPRNTARWFVAEQFARIANADGEVRRTPPLPTFWIASIFLTGVSRGTPLGGSQQGVTKFGTRILLVFSSIIT